MSGVSASPPPTFFSLEGRPKTRSFCCHQPLSHRKLRFNSLGIGCRGGGLQRDRVVQCNSSTNPPPPGSGDSDSRSILDAFFLGKALAEALNERIESTVGEFLSVVGRLQAEQQKQVQDFQIQYLMNQIIPRTRCWKGPREPKRKQPVRRWKHKDSFPSLPQQLLTVLLQQLQRPVRKPLQIHPCCLTQIALVPLTRTLF
ncbi:uncharacterized protein At4g13200, chloroplastic isoform X1 [Vitis vinifera]|uniref:uncharacterized protein At4g13200, chloroplastic isoform X1 n=1 Tax=Vitis vinifera TaxID=29760 RepID=UPI00288311A5|nr:uncharacterized protein At4g13200, chloroplastic isoform X1 [Vitis vinifera]